MSAPRLTPGDVYGVEESAQMATASRLSQTVTIGAANTAVTLRCASRVGNPTAAAGNIAVHLVDDPAGTWVVDRFAAGEQKAYRVDIIGNAAAGTTIATVLVLES